MIQEYQTGTHKRIPEFGKAHDARLLWQTVGPRQGTISTGAVKCSMRRTYPFHLRLGAVLEFTGEYLREKLPEPSSNSSIYDRVIRRCAPRPTFGVARTTEDDEWALVRRRAGTHEPVLHPVVGREAGQRELACGYSRTDRHGLPARRHNDSGPSPGGKLREQRGRVRVCRVHDVRTCHSATRCLELPTGCIVIGAGWPGSDCRHRRVCMQLQGNSR